MNRVKIDLDTVVGRIRPLHGVNNGPRTYSFFHDTSAYFREAGIPFSRLHDTEFPYGSGHFVDIPCIFKNFEADPCDPASYDFAMTDMYIKAIVDVGTQVFYRLGVSIEHAPVKRNIYPPKDFKKWAVICEHVIRHYNEGWADGFHYDIKYWEIWNEPDNTGVMWLGSREEFYRFYGIAANHLKSCFGDAIKVGGFASTGWTGACEADPTPNRRRIAEYAEGFLDYVTAPETKAPLDFYSWHTYSGDLYQYEANCRYSREALDRRGLTKTENILNEWNYSGPDRFDNMRSELGAALAAGVLCVMQHNAVDVGCYYDAQPSMCFCGIFSLETRKPTKAFYPFKAWNGLYRLKNEVLSESDNSDVRVCAASDGKKAAVLISSYESQDDTVQVRIKGCGGKTLARVYVIDKDYFFDLVSEELFTGDVVIQRKKDRYTTFYIELQPAAENG